MTDWAGDISMIVRANGTIRMEVMPGSLRVSLAILADADPRWLSQNGDVITFHSLENDGSVRSYPYRIVGGDAVDGMWARCEPVPTPELAS